VATAGLAEVALMVTGTGFSCSSRATTTRDTVLPRSKKVSVGWMERRNGPVRRALVGSPAHARAAKANAAYTARMYCRFIVALHAVMVIRI
jgi:hypothetical protein